MPPNQQQNQWALGGQYGAPAGSGYAPVPQPQQGQSAPGGQYGAPAGSGYVPVPQPGASDVPQPQEASVPQPQPARSYAPAASTGQSFGTSAQIPAPDPMTRFEPEAQFTPSFQSFVNTAPTMPGPSAAQYPQAAPQQVQAWAMPTTAKKAPVFEAVVIGVGAALMLVGISGFLFASGPFLGLLLAFCCLIPLAITLTFLQFVDRFEPEPWWTKIAALLWGGGVAIFFGIISNEIAGSVVASATGSEAAGQIFMVVVAAPVGEEFLKALGVLVIVMMRRNSISSPLDGLVYAGYSAAGFLVVEDFTYFVRGAYAGNSLNVHDACLPGCLRTHHVHLVHRLGDWMGCDAHSFGGYRYRREPPRLPDWCDDARCVERILSDLWQPRWLLVALLHHSGSAVLWLVVLRVPCDASRAARYRRRSHALRQPGLDSAQRSPDGLRSRCPPKRTLLGGKRWPRSKAGDEVLHEQLGVPRPRPGHHECARSEPGRIADTQQKVQEATTQRQTFQALMGIRPM